MPIGFVVVPGWYFAPGLPPPGGSFPMLPGGMIVDSQGLFGMIVAGWVAFTGFPPI